MDIGRRLGSFVYFSLLLVSTAALRDACPPEVLIDPCVCIRNRYPVTILCVNFNSASDLEEVMARSYDHPVTGLYLKEACMLYLPSSVILSKQTAVVTLQDCVLVSLFDRAPDSENAVTHVLLQRTRLMRGVRWDLFRTMENLTYLSLHSVEVRKVGRTFRDHVSRNLRSFAMVYSKTRRIEDDAFQDLSRLEAIQIKGALVSDLQRSMFAYPSRLYYFDFSDNLIESLPADMFESMPRLQEVLLDGNRFSLLSEVTFGKLFDCNVFRIGLEDNPLECTCSMRWFLTGRWRLPIHGNCSAPIDMQGMKLVDLSVEDFDYCLGN